MEKIDKKDAKERIEHLKKVINYHRYLYHVLDRQEISETALDSLKKELFDLEQQYPEFIVPDSPTQRVGGKPLKEFAKVRHEKPMLSFNDAFSEEDMKAWLERLENYLGRRIKQEFFCELKIDGLAIELIYKNGVLAKASTRGDGLIGEDVTQNLKTVEAIPLRLEGDPPKHLVVRGEVFLTKKEFNRINEEQIKAGQKPFANPRNIAAGSVRQLDPKVVASRRLDSFQYEIVTDLGLKTHEEKHKVLKSFGFKTNPYNQLAISLGGTFTFRNYWAKHREKLPYEIDGIVVIVNNNKDFEAGGVIGKTPRGAIAFKFSPREATTIVKDIKIQIGRTGILTPVAELEPIEVGGVRIAHSTLHNFDEIKRLGVKIGDTVIVNRAGDVIPKVVRVIKDLRAGKEREFKMPDRCPIDGSKIIQEGVLYRCSNKNCGARNRRFLDHFVSKRSFDIEGLGPKIIDRFLDEGLISDAADIFLLQKGDIDVLKRFGEKSAQNIIEEIQLKKIISLPRFINSLGILHIGEETAALLARNFKFPVSDSQIKIKDLIKVFQSLSSEKLQEVPGIGPKVAQSIYDWFHDRQNIRLLERLEKAGAKIESVKREVRGQKLKGKIFVLTGALESISREAAKEKIRALGGEVSESVGKKTSYVVAGEKAGSKLLRAQKLGIKIIDDKDFREMVK